MPLKSKAAKVDEAVAEPEVSQTDEKDSDVASVPSWRAEVVEEGVEDKTEEKEKEETQETPTTQTEEKPKEEEEKVTDLTAEPVSEASDVPETPSSSWAEETTSTPPSDNTVTISLSKKLFWLFLFLIVGALVVGGFFYYKSKVGEDPTGTTESPQATTSPEATATPTPAEEVKLDSLKVNILNGSGIPGEAGKVQALLEEAGFAEFETGNADNYNYTITEVTLKKGVSSAAFDAVKEALDEYNVVKQEDTLDEDSESDVEIVTGTKKAATSPTPSQ
ncbi:MAG: Transcriptional regulator [Candidatus Woesebacteria bacterium GW2011_GWB1_45_5]|uniref:Transcriptional regulator n=1 Tax=Candidatus Woesebacteria bacterium GW2011_GWB1_45_5 TaxID=1618581 RepID=A0A0G1ML08_9BACT|nr:MAG: Transcriptional regulator [Candidatus Woesebacteria bacterium GW2011_GWB1_45_5]